MSTESPRWIVTDPTAATDAEADRRGLTSRRDVFQLRRLLPLDTRPITETRAFVPGSVDEDNWIIVNNRAFASHPDQSAMTMSRLHADMNEAWFDPDGFRLHERSGRLAAFCWTKCHPASETDPELGEIYVIGVDPDFQGVGLGRGLTVAGLDWLSRTGVTTAMLYVDATNTAARSLYERLGFEMHHTDRVYTEPPTA